MLEQSLFSKEPSLPYPPQHKETKRDKEKDGRQQMYTEWVVVTNENCVRDLGCIYCVNSQKKSKVHEKRKQVWNLVNSRGIPSTDKGLRSRKVVLQNKYTWQYAKHAQARMMNLEWKTCGICPEERKSKRRHKTLEVWMGSPYPKDHKPALQGVRS